MQAPWRVWLFTSLALFCGLGAGLFHAAAGHAAGLASAQPAAISIEEYWQLVDNTRTQVLALEGQPDTVITKGLAELVRSWAAVSRVTLVSGQEVPVDSSYLISQLQADPPDLERLKGTLQAMLEARQRWPNRPVDPEVFASLKQILARPEFDWKEAEPTAWELFWQRFWKRVQEFFDRLFSDGGLPVIPGLQWIFVALAGLVLALALAYAFRGVWGTLVPESALVQEETGEENISAETALKRAQDLSAGGDYRSAVRYLYLSSLLLLEERSLLRYDRSKTNREYLRSVAHLPHLAAPLQEVVDVFDRVWYGYQPLDESGYRRYSERVEDLRRQR